MLTNFNKIVLSIATLILIIGLVLTGIFVSGSLYNDSYPPIVSDCPDYWDVDRDDDDNIVCKNTSTINMSTRGGETCNNYPTSLFSVNGTATDDILCEKYKWATQCSIHWDGVTNNNNACQSTTI
jgi:hypothetical protein